MQKGVTPLAAILLGAAALCGATTPVGAQQVNDVEMRGRVNGVRPPAGYYQVLARDPRAYELQRAWIEVARRVRDRRQALSASGNYSALNAHFDAGGAAGPSASVAHASGIAVTGTFRIPVLLGYFADSTHVLQPARADIDSVLFDATAPPYSVRTFYDEVTNGLVTVVGDVIGWFKVDSASTWYEGSNNGLRPSTDHTGDFIKELLDDADPSVDFRNYDNDGDGFVDLIAVLHPLRGGECGTPHIWSHRWVYAAWKGSAYTTNDAGTRVNDYIIQPAVGGSTACDSTQIMPIGTFAHELGHGMADFPDLYNTSTGKPGVGFWDLMAAGNFNTPRSPAHPGAWTKDDAGWLAIDTISDGVGTGSRTLRPIITSDTALRLLVSGRSEYFLLENRHRIGSDANLREQGLLIWHIDPDSVAARRPANRVNARLPFGVALEQADGSGHLESGANAGDAGDPFPGSSAKTVFGPGTNPSSNLNDGSPSGIQVDSITVNGDRSIGFRVNFNLVAVRITTSVGAGTRVVVDGVSRNAPHDVVWGYPSTHSIGVDSIQGDTLVRHVYVRWSDGGARIHDVVIDATPDTFVAALRTEHRLRAVAGSGGTISSSVPLDASGVAWLLPTDTARLLAIPDTANGFLFVQWSQDTTTTRDTLDLILSRPYTVRAAFGPPVAVTTAALKNGVMGASYRDTLEATGGGGAYTWSLVSGALPPGLSLASTGVVSGVPETDGSFTFLARAVSGALSDEDTVTVTVVQPALLLQDVVDHLLGRAVPLNADELRYLDLLGNQNGGFDVGDFRAYLQETGVISSAVAELMKTSPDAVDPPARMKKAAGPGDGPEEGS